MKVGDLVKNINSSYPETKLGQLFIVMGTGKYDVVKVMNVESRKMELYSVSYLEVLCK